MRERHYTLEEANAMLPWLEEVLARMVPLREQLESQQKDLLSLMQHRSGNGATSLAQQLRQDLQEITGRGIVVRDIVRGLVDFPSDRDGETILLCWLRGEPQIDYWHGTNEGFASRKRL